jgi:serine/threonine protein kinase
MNACKMPVLACSRAQVPDDSADQIGSDLGCLCRHVGLRYGCWPHAQLHCPAPPQVYSEAEKLASMRHPCVVAFYGIVVQPGSYATVLEYVRNGSLRSGLGRIKKQVGLPT